MAQHGYEEALTMASRKPLPSPPKEFEEEVRVVKTQAKSFDILAAKEAPSVRSSVQQPTIATFIPTEEDEESAPSLRPIYRSSAAHMGERPLPEDDGFYTSPDREKLKENAPALPGAGNRKEQQNIRSQMRREEERQTKEDRFWGLDNEARHQVQDGKFMAEADAHSLACRDKEKREQQHAEWEQLGQERKDEIKWRMDAENSEARRAYMRMFFEAETSDKVMDYRWPTQPSLEAYFGKTERKDWWPLTKPLAPNQRHTFHAVKGQRRHDVTQLHVDEFAKAVEEQRMLSEASIPGGGVSAGNLSINGRREPVTATASAPNPMGLLEGQSSLATTAPSGGGSLRSKRGLPGGGGGGGGGGLLTTSASAPLLSVPPAGPGGSGSRVSLAPLEGAPSPTQQAMQMQVQQQLSLEQQQQKPKKKPVPYTGGLLRGTPIDMMTKGDIRTYERLGWRVNAKDAKRLGLVTKANSPSKNAAAAAAAKDAAKDANGPVSSLSAPPLLDAQQLTQMQKSLGTKPVAKPGAKPGTTGGASVEFAPEGSVDFRADPVTSPIKDADLPQQQPSIVRSTSIAPSQPESVHETINAIKKSFTEISAAHYVEKARDPAEEQVWRDFFELASGSSSSGSSSSSSTVHGSEFAKLLGGGYDEQRSEAARSLASSSLALRAIRGEGVIRDALASLETDDPSGFSLGEWVIFCEAIHDLSVWNEGKIALE